MKWKYTDPRIDINKRTRIIIVRPCFYVTDLRWVSEAYIEDNCIFTVFDDHLLIAEDHSWGEGWCWTFAPKTKVVL